MIFTTSLSAVASSDLEKEENHQPEGIRLEELLSNQERQLSLEIKEAELPRRRGGLNKDYWPENPDLSRETILVMPLLLHKRSQASRISQICGDNSLCISPSCTSTP